MIHFNLIRYSNLKQISSKFYWKFDNSFSLNRYFSTSSSIKTLSAIYYTNSEIYEKERLNIFGKEWQLFCREEQLKSPGDYVSVNIAGFPLFVIRDKNGGIQGFHNVCRHRANPIVPFDNLGKCELLRCKYHGWVYDSNGSLKSCIGFNKEEINKQDFGLYKIKVDTWSGLVFINLDQSSKPFKEWMGGIDDECKKFEIENFKYKTDIMREFKVNWKTYVDNYQEGYHIPTIHPELNRILESKHYKVTNIFHNGTYSVHNCPSRQNPLQKNDGLWLYVWPNLAINIYTWGMSIERIIPVNLNTTRLLLNIFMKKVDAPTKEEIEKKEEEHIKEFLKFEDTLLQEDIDVCLNVQKNLEAGIYKEGLLSPSMETGVQFFQKLVKKAVES